MDVPSRTFYITRLGVLNEGNAQLSGLFFPILNLEFGSNLFPINHLGCQRNSILIGLFWPFLAK
jgi:hypothetical protein